MARQKLTHLLVVIISLFLCVACGNGGNRLCLSGFCGDSSLFSDGSGEPVEEPDDDNAGAFNCTASPSNSLVYNAEIFTLNIYAAGGTAPYRIPGYIDSFASTTALNGGYYNNGSTDRIVQRTVAVVDAQNRAAYCNFSVTVRSAAAPSSLACTITANPAAPKIGEVTEFTIVATGADSVTFDQFYAQTGWGATVTRNSNTQAKVAIIYRTEGTRNANIRISSGGTQAICSLPIEVRKPSLEASADVSLAQIGQPITVKALAKGFDASIPVDYKFTTSEPGIQILANGDSATVQSADGKYHRFSLKVEATNANGEAATPVDLDLTFSSAAFLGCRIDASPIQADGSILFTVSSSNSSTINDQMQITYFDAGPGSVLVSPPLSNPVAYRLPASGFRVVSARAKSAITGTPCQNGQVFSTVVRVRERLNRCDVVTAPNPSIEGHEVVGTVSVPPNVGVGPFRVDFTALPGATRLASNNPLQFRFVQPNPGVYPIQVDVTDLGDNTTVHCNTTHNVIENIVTKNVSCYSNDYRYTECEVGGEIRNLFLTQKISKASCTFGRTYGIAGSRIWASAGCRANFEVRARIR